MVPLLCVLLILEKFSFIVFLVLPVFCPLIIEIETLVVIASPLDTFNVSVNVIVNSPFIICDEVAT